MQKPSGPFPSAQKPIAVIGYSEHALVVIDAMHSQGRQVQAYCDPEQKEQNPHQLMYLGPEQDVVAQLQGFDVFVAIGDNSKRQKVAKQLIASGIGLTRAVHASAIVSGLAKIGAGAFIGPLAVVNALAEIGAGAICNSGAIVEHGCVVAEFAHIGPGATLAGNVQVGRNSLVGANAVVRPGVKIGENVIIGAGSVVIDNISDNFSVAGNPAKPIK